MKREEILEKAKECVCTDREDQYGQPEDNFGTIADLWSTYLKKTVTSEDVAIMMMLLKIARLCNGRKDHMDSWIDIAGYAACGGEIAEKDSGTMVDGYQIGDEVETSAGDVGIVVGFTKYIDCSDKLKVLSKNGSLYGFLDTKLWKKTGRSFDGVRRAISQLEKVSEEN